MPENIFCSGCGEKVRNGKPVAFYDGHLWHATCAIEASAPPPFYYRERVKLN